MSGFVYLNWLPNRGVLVQVNFKNKQAPLSRLFTCQTSASSLASPCRLHPQEYSLQHRKPLYLFFKVFLASIILYRACSPHKARLKWSSVSPRLRNQIMAPESRLSTAIEPEDMQKVLSSFETGLIAGGGEETSDETNIEANSQMAVDALCADMETIAIHEPDQQARGTRSTTHTHYTDLSLDTRPGI